MTIKEALAKLSEADYAALMVAFEEGNSMHFEYTDGRFVGVNIVANGLQIEQQEGLFSEGLILGAKDDPGTMPKMS